MENRLVKRFIGMAPAEYAKAKDQLGLSHTRMGEVFGFTGRTSRAYASGDVPIGVTLAQLIRLCLLLKIPPKQIERLRAANARVEFFTGDGTVVVMVKGGE